MNLILPVLLLLALPVYESAVYKFTPYGEDQVAIRMDAEFTITIKAVKENQELAKFSQGSSMSGDQVGVFGVHGPKSFLQLRFKDGVDWSLIFSMKSQNDVSLTRMVQFIPDRLFPNLGVTDDLLVFKEGREFDLKSAQKSFACDRQLTGWYIAQSAMPGGIQFQVMVTVSNFRVQAYNMNDGNFSPAVHCDLDTGKTEKPVPTTTPKSTTTTTTTVAPGDHTNSAKTTSSYTGSTPEASTTSPTPSTPTTTGPPVVKPGRPYGAFYGSTDLGSDKFWCISLEGRISFEIAYEAHLNPFATMSKTLEIGVPGDAEVITECFAGKNLQKMTLKFYNEWSMDFQFKLNQEVRNSDAYGESQSKLEYHMESVHFTYTLNPYIFPKVDSSRGYKSTLNLTRKDDHLPLKKITKGFFACDALKRYEMSPDVVMVTSDLKFKAFIQNQDIGFYGVPDKCDEDQGRKVNGMAIAVGCLIVTSLLFVLIAAVAFIVRYKKRMRRRNRYRSI